MADEEAEKYLQQSFFKKIDEKENEDKKYATSWSQPNTVKVISTSRATFYGERKNKDETETALSKATHEATGIKPSEEEIMNGIRKETRDATAKETQEETNHKEPSSPPEPKVLPRSPGNESKYSQTKKPTSKDIMVMINNGDLTDEKAEMEFKKSEEKFLQN